jgi:hypothetical protein
MSWSNLFQQSSKALKEAALQEFRQTAIGEVMESFERGKREGRKGSGQFISAIRRAANNPLFQTAREIQRYAKHTKADVPERFFEALGPAGQLLRAMILPKARPSPRTANVDSMIESAINLLQAFGFEVLSKKATGKDLNRQVSAAREMLEGLGYKVIPPEQAAEEPSVRETFPFGIPKKTKAGKERRTVMLPTDSRQRTFPADHPIVTGRMVTDFSSSNVYGFSYDVENWYLYVRYKASGDKGSKTLSGAGSLYRYSQVSPKIFLAMLKAPSKGTFIWDNIRERGTVSGHKYPYELYGIAAGYVPRQARLTARGEEYVPRTIRLLGSGRTAKSQLGRELVRPLSFVNRGSANRGNKGTPSRGR